LIGKSIIKYNKSIKLVSFEEMLEQEVEQFLLADVAQKIMTTGLQKSISNFSKKNCKHTNEHLHYLVPKLAFFKSIIEFILEKNVKLSASPSERWCL
jgi:hypothetical protein